MIGSLVEYVGAFEDFYGKRGIVVSVDKRQFFKNEPCYQIAWVPAVKFGGRIVSRSTFIHQDLKFLTKTRSEGKNASK